MVVGEMAALGQQCCEFAAGHRQFAWRSAHFADLPLAEEDHRVVGDREILVRVHVEAAVGLGQSL